jgi:hypothetical protein
VPEVTWDVDPFCPEAHDWAYVSSQFWVASAVQLRHSMPGLFEDQLAATRGLAEHAPKVEAAFFERSARWLKAFGALWTRAGWRWQGVDVSSPYALPEWGRLFEVTIKRLRSCDIRDDLRAGVENVLFTVQSVWKELSPADQAKVIDMLRKIGLSPNRLS